jgi:hypothetical protein
MFGYVATLLYFVENTIELVLLSRYERAITFDCVILSGFCFLSLNLSSSVSFNQALILKQISAHIHHHHMTTLINTLKRTTPTVTKIVIINQEGGVLLRVQGVIPLPRVVMGMDVEVGRGRHLF